MDNHGRVFVNQLHNYVVPEQSQKPVHVDTGHVVQAVSAMLGDRLGSLEGLIQQSCQSLAALTKTVDFLCSEVRELGNLCRANLHSRSAQVKTSEAGVQCSLLEGARPQDVVQRPGEGVKYPQTKEFLLSTADLDSRLKVVGSSKVVEPVGEPVGGLKVERKKDTSQRQQQSELRIIKCVSLRTGAEADVNQAAGGSAAPRQVDRRLKVKLRKTKQMRISSLEQQVEGRNQEQRSPTRRTAPQRTSSPLLKPTHSGSKDSKVEERKCQKRGRAELSSSEPPTEDSSDLSDESESVKGK
ncbi:uncharacterized protein ACB058_002109 isoform 1-T1 [Synchiropus picturatus]